MKTFIIVLICLALVSPLSACGGSAPAQQPSAEPQADTKPAATDALEPDTPAEEATAAFFVTSGGIVDGVIGDAFGARADQTEKGVPTRSFALSFAGIPDGTACFALSMIDPDGGDWVHWIAVNIPAGDIAENASVEQTADFVQGMNDFGFTGYGGPTPPRGTHTYVITVYALSESVPLENGFTLDQFNAAIEGNILASAVLTGDYAR